MSYDKKNNVDVIVIGGGPSGLMASIAAAENGRKVLLLEKGKNWARSLRFQAAVAAMSRTGYHKKRS